MSDVAVMQVVGSEPEAEIVCSLLRTAGIKCYHRATNTGSGAADGMPFGGPRAILVREADLAKANEILQARRQGWAARGAQSDTARTSGREWGPGIPAGSCRWNRA